MTKILVPVDGSEGSDKAVRFAISLVEGKEAEFIVLNVQLSLNTPNVKRFFSQEEVRAYQEALSKEVLDHTLEVTNEFAIPVRTVVRIGDPGEEILAEAQESSVDYIVMGYRGLGPVKRAILGSVATQVLAWDTVPGYDCAVIALFIIAGPLFILSAFSMNTKGACRLAL